PRGGAAGKLQVAKSARQAGNTAAAWQAIRSVSIADLPPDRRLVAAELKADIALASDHPQAALSALAAAPVAPKTSDQARLLALKGRALFAEGETAKGLELLVERGNLYTADADVRANNQLTWKLISNVSALPSPKGLSKTAQGWLALARIARTAWSESGEFNQRIQQWRANWPDHPANTGLVARIQARASRQLQYPVKIALLLPLSGAYAEQAGAVEAGLLAGYYHNAGRRPTIAIYDTHGTAQGARAALTKARAEAANFVVGPLTPAGVNAIVSLRPAMPVLALNYLKGDEKTPPRFFQFGLSPMQEARSVAERAVSQGLLRAVVIVPANGWGRSIEQAFSQRMSALGGQVLRSAEYQPGAVHFAAPLSSLLGGANAGETKQAPNAMTAAIASASSTGYGPQFVFFAAPLQTAQLLVSQIAYYGGFGLPVYSISNVYQPGASSDNLDGVRFPIMPWFVASEGPMASLRNEVSALFPQSWHDDASLYALGYDAWRLIPLLGNGAAQPLAASVLGVTGTLGLGPNNVIRRHADWAQYVNGRVEPIGAPVATSAPAPTTQ
ncbi:MAG: penicillin-binding protein activator, partial [Gammaproteobacteria bacterium]